MKNLYKTLLILVFSIILIGSVSASWYNPLSWFGEDNSVNQAYESSIGYTGEDFYDDKESLLSSTRQSFNGATNFDFSPNPNSAFDVDLVDETKSKALWTRTYQGKSSEETSKYKYSGEVSGQKVDLFSYDAGKTFYDLKTGNQFRKETTSKGNDIFYSRTDVAFEKGALSGINKDVSNSYTQKITFNKLQADREALYNQISFIPDSNGKATPNLGSRVKISEEIILLDNQYKSLDPTSPQASELKQKMNEGLIEYNTNYKPGSIFEDTSQLSYSDEIIVQLRNQNNEDVVNLAQKEEEFKLIDSELNTFESSMTNDAKVKTAEELKFELDFNQARINQLENYDKEMDLSTESLKTHAPEIVADGYNPEELTQNIDSRSETRTEDLQEVQTAAYSEAEKVTTTKQSTQSTTTSASTPIEIPASQIVGGTSSAAVGFLSFPNNAGNYCSGSGGSLYGQSLGVLSGPFETFMKLISNETSVFFLMFIFFFMLIYGITYASLSKAKLFSGQKKPLKAVSLAIGFITNLSFFGLTAKHGGPQAALMRIIHMGELLFGIMIVTIFFFVIYYSFKKEGESGGNWKAGLAGAGIALILVGNLICHPEWNAWGSLMLFIAIIAWLMSGISSWKKGDSNDHEKLSKTDTNPHYNPHEKNPHVDEHGKVEPTKDGPKPSDTAVRSSDGKLLSPGEPTLAPTDEGVEMTWQ